jgi:YidC/Oxa1 family membrane protein insertase
MDKLRLYVWIALAAVLYICYMVWQQDYPPPPQVDATSATTAPTNSLPVLPGETSSPPTTSPSSSQATSAPPATPTVVSSNAAKVLVRTDVLDLSISTQGGELDRADLLKYPTSKEHPEKVVRLLDSTSENFYVARSGLRSADEHIAPSHLAIFSAASDNYELAAGHDTLTVPLTWTEGSVKVTKSYTLRRGSYVIAIDYKVENQSQNEWKAASYIQLARHQPIVKASMFNAETYAFLGPAVCDGKSINNLKLDKEESKHFSASYAGGWFAAMQHHFVTAAVPKADLTYDYQLNVESPQQYTATYRGPLVNVAAGGTGEFHETLFVGPKIQTQLENVAPTLVLTADYGRLKIVAGPLFWILAKVHAFIGNWGWSIILVTLFIKAVFYKLTEASGKSMAKMREMAPRLKALQERYKDDREQLGRATMEFYKREKINPLAGCLPTLIQMPVWMAFYWVILNSAEMRQAPFIGYISDLSSQDPYFILPIILGIANFAQFKLNPAPADPVQAKVMMLMPLVMTGMMAFFPSGLALYWITNTGLSIAQQWHINRVVAAGAKKA